MSKPLTKFSRRTMLKASAAMGAITLTQTTAVAIASGCDTWRLVTTHEPDHARIVFASHSRLKIDVASMATNIAEIRQADAIFVLSTDGDGTEQPLPNEIYEAHREGILTAAIRTDPVAATTVMSDIARLYGSDETVFRCNDLEDMRLILNSSRDAEIPMMVAACATASGENAVRDSLSDSMRQMVSAHGVELDKVKRILIIVAGKRRNLRLDNVCRAYSFLLRQFAHKAWVLYGAIYDDEMDSDIRTTLMIGEVDKSELSAHQWNDILL
jgi:cell division GTPase FtsZ